MRMCKLRSAAAFLAFIVLAPVAIGAENPPPYASATEAYRDGAAALSAGHRGEATAALTYAAERGVLGAELKLARAYASGEGLPKDDAKAFAYYQQIADQHADITPLSPVAQYVAEAFVALGQYWLDGIPATGMAADPERAAGLFRHAASYFGDAEAQYRLGRLYLNGEGVDQNRDLAANWLAAAAKKQNAPAQAALGNLLWQDSGVRSQSARGLALLMLAHQNAEADDADRSWIDDLYKKAMAKADAVTLKEAHAIMPEWGNPAPDVTASGEKDDPSGPIVVPASGSATPIVRPAVADSVAVDDLKGAANPASQTVPSLGFGGSSAAAGAPSAPAIKQ